MEAMADLAQYRKIFLASQVGFMVMVVLVARWLLRRNESAFFKPRSKEDPTAKPKSPGGPDLLAQARYAPKPQPLRLEGIRLGGAPHEVLGVSPAASEAEVQAAYRELMKRYHPDRVGRPGTREWQDAQAIAHALNQAKSELLSKAKAKKPHS
jgi:DnaJ-domain-containing protein 1